jgi:uncharacterized protein
MARAPVCVYCREQPVSERWRPFCSERCWLLDLSRWLDDSYRVPGPEAADDEQPAPDEGNEAADPPRDSRHE